MDALLLPGFQIRGEAGPPPSYVFLTHSTINKSQSAVEHWPAIGVGFNDLLLEESGAWKYRANAVGWNSQFSQLGPGHDEEVISSPLQVRVSLRKSRLALLIHSWVERCLVAAVKSTVFVGAVHQSQLCRSWPAP